MSLRYNASDAHSRALCAIKDDADIGRLPFFDYAIEYCAYFGQNAPEPTVGLIRFLEDCQKIGDSKQAQIAIESLYREHELEIPIGLMDLPVWWARAIAASIHEVNWVEPDPGRTQDVFGWTMVHLQGPYLDIQYANPIPIQSVDWHVIGSELWNLHRRFEPGPFTPVGRLIEFI